MYNIAHRLSRRRGVRRCTPVSLAAIFGLALILIRCLLIFIDPLKLVPQVLH